MKSVGIDIGSYSIKVAEISLARKNAVVTDYKEYPFSPNANADKTLETIEILRELSKRYDPANTKIVFAVNQNEVSSRRRPFPFRERQKILKSLAFELEDEIPFDLGETAFDAKICEYIGNLSQVMICACPFETVRDHINQAKEGGFDPEILSVDGFALTNLVENWNAPPPESTGPVTLSSDEEQPVEVTPGRLLLHLGHTRSLLLAYNTHGLVSVRSILWGGLDIAKGISRVFSLPLAEAVKVVQTRSYILMSSAGASSEQILLSNTVAETLTDLIKELRFSILELKSEFNLSFPQIEIMGGVSRLQNIAPYLTQSLELPANIYNYLSRIGLAFTATPEMEASSAVAIGLAIEGLKTIRNPPINLRRGEFTKQNLTFTVFWDKWKQAIQIGAVALLVVYFHSIMRDSFSQTLATAAEDALTKQAKTVNRTSTTLEEYLKKQNSMIKTRESLQQLDHYVGALDYLADLSQKMPQNQNDAGTKLKVDITHFSIENDDVSVEGHVDSPAHLKSVERVLKQMASGEIRNTQVARAGAEGTPFSYHFKNSTYAYRT